MASVKIILKKRSTSPEGEGILYLQLINSRSDKTEISLRRRIPVKYWDVKNERAKRGFSGFNPLNVFLRNEKAAYEQIINMKEARGEAFTVRQLIKERKGIIFDAPVINKDIITYLENYINDNPEGLGHNTLKTYRSCLRRLRDYKRKIDYDQIDLRWIQRFEKHLFKIGNKVNTVSDKMKVLTKIYKLLIREGRVTKSPFDHYKRKKEEGKREFLTREEFAAFQAVEIEHRTHQEVKDIFEFAVLTGLRFSDICTLRAEDVKILNDESYRMTIRMNKTQDLLHMKLPIKAASIFQKYADENNSLFVFPILNVSKDLSTDELLKKEISRRNAYYNQVVKILCAKSGIEKKISMHCARHTFGTLSLDLGIPIQVVSKLMGHKNLRETQIYAKILDKQKDAAMDAWNQL